MLTDQASCTTYGYDNSQCHAPPLAVVLPETHQHVSDIMGLCYQYKMPLYPRGRGTGTTGATVPTQKGIVLSCEKMRNILEFSVNDRYLVTQPGVTNQEVQQKAAENGFFWPPDPTSSAFCSIGGNLAYNSAGPRTVKYGSVRDNVLGLTAVTGKGETIHTGVYTNKGVVGYDLTRLLIGSEGTLAIITQATLKLTPLPQSKQTFQAIYQEITSAAQAVSDIMAQSVIPCALEFIDHHAIALVQQYGITMPQGAGAMLMIEIDGLESSMQEAALLIKKAASNRGLLSWQQASSKQEVEDLWKTRKALSPALRQIAPKKINEDIVVPVSKIPDLIMALDKISEQFSIPIVNFGHAGNGNIHVNLLINPEDKDQLKRSETCLEKVFDKVLELKGTISGEHGIGLVKRNFVAKEIDPVTLNLMHNIKRQFDPKNILNPGKMLPDQPIN